MFDCHFDLLMYVYMCRNNIEKVKKYCDGIFKGDNITGGIFNFCYVDIDKLETVLGMPEKDIDVVENFRVMNELVKEYKIIPEDVVYILGIEGLDYLADIEDIDKLYELGLRSTNIVWNNPNKFGGGTKASADIGLTELGKRLVEKLVRTNVAIDLSHTNEKTFYGIIEECKQLKLQGLNPILHASHSNSRAICGVPRNLTDEQIKVIANDFNGTIGIVEYTPFVKDVGVDVPGNPSYEQYYLKHINHVKELLGGIDNISVSTDDMTFEYDESEKPPVYKHEEVAKMIRKLLESNGYAKEEIEKILHKNFETKILCKVI